MNPVELLIIGAAYDYIAAGHEYSPVMLAAASIVNQVSQPCDCDWLYPEEDKCSCS